MKIQFSSAFECNPAQIEGTVVAFVPGNGKLKGASDAVDAALRGGISRAISTSRFHAKHGDLLEFPVPDGFKATRVFAAGLGIEDLDEQGARALGGKIAAALGRLDESGATLLAQDLAPDHAVEVALGARLRRYAFTTYKSTVDSKSDFGPGPIMLLVEDPDAVEAASWNAEARAEGVFFARDLVSEPANALYPESYADRLVALSELGVEVEVLKDEELEKLGMGALLAVGLGSAHGSRVVAMKWLNADDKKRAPLCVVGKGVTFDTGGISLKPAGGMEEMTMDMGGSAVVAGLMKTLALRKAKANVIGIVGLVENMPDGLATRPGDIVTSMAGKTIEVINTDAEGRLVLADVLHYAQTSYKPAATIDLATLTGAMIIALGNSNAGFFANDDGLAGDLKSAADAEGEGLWRLPLGKEYDDQLKSALADMKNTGGRAAGGITAAQFLQRFVDDSPWAHIDIAGVTLQKEPKPTCPKGASGWGVATLDRLVRDRYED